MDADITKRRKYTKMIIDIQTNLLLKELVNIRDGTLQEIECDKNDLERKVVIIESFRR